MTWLAALLLALILLAGGLYGGYLAGMRYLENALAPVAPQAAAVQEVRINIPAGAGAAQIAEILHQQGLIRHPLVLRLQAKVMGVDARLKPGDYTLHTGMSVAELIDRLVQGPPPDLARITVPEGLTVEATARLLAANGWGTEKALLEAMQDRDLVREFLPPGAPVRQPLEGYLFPDTYLVAPDITEAEIVALMVDGVRAIWTPDRRAQASELGLTPHQVMTLAAVIEKEAQIDQERPLISGVFHNRLALGMRLEADPTVRYAVNLPYSEPVLNVHLKAEDPYNTYYSFGLPPGPIASPGEASINAALYPAETDSLFFVAREDGSGEHVFSRTMDQHLAAIAQVRSGR